MGMNDGVWVFLFWNNDWDRESRKWIKWNKM